MSLVALGAAVAGLAGCANVPAIGPYGGEPPPPPVAAAPTPPVTTEPLSPVAGQTFGTGPVRVALIVPLTQGQEQSPVGQSLRNAAELAIADTSAGGINSVTVLVKDDNASPQAAQAAARAAMQDGAQLIVGPLYANNVREVGGVARAGNVPVIAFSTDPSVAARGVYLLSFLVASDVDRIVSYAASRGKKSFGALVPNGDYGNIALAEFQQAAAAKGLRVQAIERYDAGSLTAAAQRIGQISNQIDALFIPEQASNMANVSRALTAAGVSPSEVQIVGAGVWNDSRVLNLPLLQGAWFSAPENAGFRSFADRYRARFKTDPTRIATLAYDAVTLAVALAAQQNPDRFGAGALTNPSGFNGADGLFRFRADGLSERGLAVLQIRSGSTTVVSPAPRTFAGRGGA